MTSYTIYKKAALPEYLRNILLQGEVLHSHAAESGLEKTIHFHLTSFDSSLHFKPE